MTPSTSHAQVVASKASVEVESVHFIAVREANRTVFHMSVALPSGTAGGVVVPIDGASTNKEPPRLLTGGESPFFERLDALTAPRLVEYWEQDPCEFHTGGPDDGVAERDVRTPAGAPPVAPAPQPTADAVELFDTIADLKTALSEGGFALPEGAESVLEEREGARFAWVPTTSDTINVRWAVAGDKTVIPLRLLSTHALDKTKKVGSTRVVIDVLSGKHRFEAANRTNLAAPTNANVAFGVKGSTDLFHGAVLAKLFAAQPAAIVTEYAWKANSCSPCTGAPLDAAALGALGVSAKGAHEVMIFTEGKIATKPDGPPALRQALMTCYGKALEAGPSLSGEITVGVDIAAGKATKTTPPAGDDVSSDLVTCVENAVKATTFDGEGTSGKVRVQFQPVSRKFMSNVILTRLRANVAHEADSDLILRPASAIAGGAEVGPTGAPQPGAYATPGVSNFQSRYTVRHAWAGDKPACMNPKRGKWGAPPQGVTPKTPPQPLTAANLKVDDLIVGTLPTLDELTMRFPAVGQTQRPSPSPRPMPSAAPSASASASPPPTAATKSAPYDDSGRPRWVGYLALVVCVLALWQAVRAQHT